MYRFKIVFKACKFHIMPQNESMACILIFIHKVIINWKQYLKDTNKWFIAKEILKLTFLDVIIEISDAISVNIEILMPDASQYTSFCTTNRPWKISISCY